MDDPKYKLGWPLAPHVCLQLTEMLMAQGITPDALFEGTRITFEELQKEDTLVPYTQVLRLLNNARALYQGQGLGMELGAQQNHASWGLLGWLMSSCRTLGEALEKSSRYYQVAPNWLYISIRQEGLQVAITASFPFDVGPCAVLMVEELFCSFLPGVQSLSGKRIQISKVSLSYPAPSYAQSYASYFQCPVEFDQPANELYFSVDYLLLPMLLANNLTCKMAEQACEKKLLENYQQGTFYQRIRSLMHAGSFGQDYSEVSVARYFGISLRTLRRYLRNEGKSFRVLIDEVRCQQAILLLQQTGYSVAKIAEELSYADVSNFRRAFKRWTGQTPRELRKKLLASQSTE